MSVWIPLEIGMDMREKLMKSEHRSLKGLKVISLNDQLNQLIT